MAAIDYAWIIVTAFFVAAGLSGARSRPKGHRGSSYAALVYGFAASGATIAANAGADVLESVALLAAFASVIAMRFAFERQRERILNYHIAAVEQAMREREHE